MMGGVIPGGSVLVLLCDTAVSWATPVATSAVGWKKTFITATPGKDCDSMCSMSLTATEQDRSAVVTIRSSISSGDMPLYCQITVATRSGIAGEMSTGGGMI